MRFEELGVAGAYAVDLEPTLDDRGFFARAFSVEDFAARGLAPEVAQCSLSYNARKGTLRGLHFQVAPHEEAKLVRCIAGAIHDVVADLRPGSPTYRRWAAVELSAANRRALYVPPGCAHGFQTLVDGAEVLYQISAPYRAEAARGVRWDDPALAIRWPLPDPIVSARDRSWPLL